MQENTRRNRAGVTLTELLVVLVVIGLLATLALPVAINRANQTRFSVARAEAEALANGEEAAAMIHGFYVPLQMLDDLPTDRLTSGGEIVDDIGNEPSSIQLINANRNIRLQDGDQLSLVSNDSRVERLRREWAGPFVQPQRVFIGGGFDQGQGQQLTSSQVARDFPLDPWGNPYRLYSPIGIVGSTTIENITEDLIDSDSFSNGNLTNVDDRFDRFAVVSFGPDGESDRTETSGSTGGDPILGDDIIYLFGTVVRERETQEFPSGF